MPLLRGLEKEFSQTKPFQGLKVALSVHLEAKTAYLCRVLAAGGADMYITGSNPLSTQDDGGDLVNMMHSEFPDLIAGVIGGCEETTTGIMRLQETT